MITDNVQSIQPLSSLGHRWNSSLALLTVPTLFLMPHFKKFWNSNFPEIQFIHSFIIQNKLESLKLQGILSLISTFSFCYSSQTGVTLLFFWLLILVQSFLLSAFPIVLSHWFPISWSITQMSLPLSKLFLIFQLLFSSTPSPKLSFHTVNSGKFFTYSLMTLPCF